jgi:rhodanese-related sulfurtransferase
MRRLLFLLLTVFLTAALLSGMGKGPKAEEVPRMTVEELKAEHGSLDLVVIDVRTERDWEASDRKIAGAVREDPASPQQWAEKYAKESRIVLYCT